MSALAKSAYAASTCAPAVAFLAAAPAIAQVSAPSPASLTALAPGLAQPVAVFGKDDRRTLPARLSALKNAIGLIINNRARSVCTGFCVADNVAATAAHCLFRTAGERRPSLRAFRFILKSHPQQLVSPIEGFRARSPAQFIIAGSRKLRVEPPIDATHDWALMRLSKPICKGAALPVAAMAPRDIAREARRKRLTQVAYHHDVANWRLAYAGPCPSPRVKTRRRHNIKRDFTAPRTLVLHTCDTGGASSGSPLLRLVRNGPPQVVAINVGTYIQTRMKVRKGKVIRRFKADAIANTAVTMHALRPLIKPFAAADIIHKRREIVAIQKALHTRGHYSKRIDGHFGPATRAAIEAYQGTTSTALSGLPTRELLAHLTAAPPSVPDLQTERRSQQLTGGRLNERIKSRRRR